MSAIQTNSLNPGFAEWGEVFGDPVVDACVVNKRYAKPSMGFSCTDRRAGPGRTRTSSQTVMSGMRAPEKPEESDD